MPMTTLSTRVKINRLQLTTLSLCSSVTLLCHSSLQIFISTFADSVCRDPQAELPDSEHWAGSWWRHRLVQVWAGHWSRHWCSPLTPNTQHSRGCPDPGPCVGPHIAPITDPPEPGLEAGPRDSTGGQPHSAQPRLTHMISPRYRPAAAPAAWPSPRSPATDTSRGGQLARPGHHTQPRRGRITQSRHLSAKASF